MNDIPPEATMQDSPLQQLPHDDFLDDQDFDVMMDSLGLKAS